MTECCYQVSQALRFASSVALSTAYEVKSGALVMVGRNIATVLVLFLVDPGDHLLVAGVAGDGGCSDEVPNGDRWRLREADQNKK